MKPNSYYLNIAGFIIHIFSTNNDIELEITENYYPYLTENSNTPTVNIEVIQGIPDDYNTTQDLFSAKHEGSENDSAYFWNIKKYGSDFLLLTSFPGTNQYPVLALLFNRDKKNWKLFYTNEFVLNKKVNPFLYPMGSLILYYLSVFNNAVMIHASGVTINNKAYLFSGVSGIGKSTMANLWLESGAKIINDDRLIIRNENGKYFLHNTPMYYPDKPKTSELKAIFLLKQTKENEIYKIKGVSAISKIMANVIQHHYEKQQIDDMFNLLSDLIHKTPIYDVGFVPNNSIVKFIQSNV